MNKFIQFLSVNEETTSGDIASVETRLGSKTPVRNRARECKKHGVLDCEECRKSRKREEW